MSLFTISVKEKRGSTERNATETLLLAESHETRRTHRRQKREGEEMVSFSFRIASSPSYNCIISSSPFLKPIAWRLSASYKQQRLLPAPGAAKERRLNIHSSNSSRSCTPLCTTTKAVSPLTAETAATDGEGREGGKLTTVECSFSRCWISLSYNCTQCQFCAKGEEDDDSSRW